MPECGTVHSPVGDIAGRRGCSCRAGRLSGLDVSAEAFGSYHPTRGATLRLSLCTAEAPVGILAATIGRLRVVRLPSSHFRKYPGKSLAQAGAPDDECNGFPRCRPCQRHGGGCLERRCIRRQTAFDRDGGAAVPMPPRAKVGCVASVVLAGEFLQFHCTVPENASGSRFP